ncbi:MerR family transcriptional regulator [Acetobacter tropicalis]|uniref:Transcriptional regulator, MerR family n=1 Tax=Acetobacter tropicalis TaxID=104102 RepID=A0A094YLZ8_9PROT|nr:MerR family transcriptional regulator [Acetobacter tropicalis]KGB22367.1 Transcriptional regulator, MerR family [Acetobacter tropicalis]MDO8172871.1 MerR family transcriptional regulator [Acetobacter tropicalis]
MTEGTFSSPEDSIPTQSEEDTFSRSEKGPLAFRTISEVADELHVPQHVLRFWETRFEQVRPLKRGGGRRYYRPTDIELLRYIADLLYSKGYTVKGVQRLLREGNHSVEMPQVETTPPQGVEEPVAGEATVEPELSEPLVLETVEPVAAVAVAEFSETAARPESAKTEEADAGPVVPEPEEGVVVQRVEVIESVENVSSPADTTPADLPLQEGEPEAHAQLESIAETEVVEPREDVSSEPVGTVTEGDVRAAFGEEEPTATDDTAEAEPTADPLPDEGEAGVQDAGQNVVQLKRQNTRLRNDLADILLELQALRSRLSA